MDCLQKLTAYDEADRKHPAPAGYRGQGHSTDGIAVGTATG
jgi:hypothetical protein